MTREPCVACANNARLPDLPPRERIAVHGGWRLAHAYGVAWPGWLVAVPTRHFESLADASASEAASLGPLLRAASAALVDVLGCVKTYVVLYAEKEGHAHTHFHVIPRDADLAPALRGPGAFTLMGAGEVPEADRDALALSLRPRIEALLN